MTKLAHGSHITTVVMTPEMGLWIKERNMTYSGAFREGIKAMQERLEWNAERRELVANVDKYRRAWLETKKQLEQLMEERHDTTNQNSI